MSSHGAATWLTTSASFDRNRLTIYAFTPSEEVARRLTLNWATIPIVMRFDLDPEHTVAEAERLLLNRGLVQIGTQLVIFTDILTGSDRFDSIQLRRGRLGDCSIAHACHAELLEVDIGGATKAASPEGALTEERRP